MSRSFLGFGQVPYIGQPFTRAIKLAGISGVAVPLLFQWQSYGAATAKPNINVLVNMEGLATCKALDQIRSVYIDNLGSDNPVYVYFPDTGYTLAAKANSEGWYPAYTNAKQIWVVGEGFLTGSIPQCFLLVSNIPMPPDVNSEIDNAVALWRASPIITRGNSIYNASLGIPALGDTFNSPTFTGLIAGNTATLWGTPYTSGFLYVTSLCVNLAGLSNTAGQVVANLGLESTGIAGVLMTLFFLATPTGGGINPTAAQGVYNILNLTGLQLKLDATQSWRARVGIGTSGGGFQVLSSFTVQP